ncbi:SnoaL-like domain-containing protein [Marinigracilibium pacificum]|uniref:Nuclear transport factor 2 family protein n=1 Tax=Marinigracilibium pacificum TaxID=2729599 RepID=A0A848IX79_9BACT|nr:SnoaL-like domain-containing protein [Marinigracilibium pacificum]NMM49133.1 nuclear transport factor 2 family protein [Marinigracilibium pacificum]
MSYLDKATHLYEMINSGQLLDAFEKYYSENIVMQENSEEPRVGKESNREYEKNFLSNIQEFHGAGVGAITSNEDTKTTMVESWMDVTFKGDQRVKLEQVAVQKWDGDQIVNERFYHQ